MKTNVKSTLIIFAALIIGAGIGFEISEISIQKEFDKMDAFRKPQGFVHIFDGIIKPDQRQKPIVDSLLFRYHEKIENARMKSMDVVSQIMDSMRVELGNAIDPKQKATLEAEMLRMKKSHPPEPGKKR
jgi:hypothetical protein